MVADLGGSEKGPKTLKWLASPSSSLVRKFLIAFQADMLFLHDKGVRVSSTAIGGNQTLSYLSHFPYSTPNHQVFIRLKSMQRLEFGGSATTARIAI